VCRNDSVPTLRRLNDIGEHGRATSNSESPRNFASVDRVGDDDGEGGMSVDSSVERGHSWGNKGSRGVGTFGEDDLLCTEGTQIANEVFSFSGSDYDNRYRSTHCRGGGEGGPGAGRESSGGGRFDESKNVRHCGVLDQSVGYEVVGKLFGR
jgi:hypothetical protein